MRQVQIPYSDKNKNKRYYRSNLLFNNIIYNIQLIQKNLEHQENNLERKDRLNKYIILCEIKQM